MTQATTTKLTDWLALLHQGISADAYLKARAAAGSDAEEGRGDSLPGLESKLDAARRKFKQEIAEDLAWRDASDQHHILSYDDELYPPLLREIKGAPSVLFVRGAAEQLCFPLFGIVGSRKPSREGLGNAKSFSSYIARQGLCIVSGLAYGIDRAAHEGAASERGRTIAVVGTGIDVTYPRVHEGLADAIVAQGGAILSCFPRATKPLAYNFPARNRIISGMSLGLLVVEAGLRSGAMITARLATEQGREVFAIPGSIHHPLAKGTNALIKQGANLAESYQDIITQLRPVYSSYSDKLAKSGGAPSDGELAPDQETESRTAPPAGEPASDQETESQTAPPDDTGAKRAAAAALAPAAPAAEDLGGSDPVADQLVRILRKDALSADELAKITAVPIDQISSALIMLELDGKIYNEKGNYKLVK